MPQNAYVCELSPAHHPYDAIIGVIDGTVTHAVASNGLAHPPMKI